MASDAELTVSDSSAKLMKLQDSFRYWTTSLGSSNQSRPLPMEFLSILRSNSHQSER